ncbi:MAG: aspartate--tRNA ligase, partial [Pirellulaceae bacterium]|nr:aspartate--tRNA ligase [Pirellulaceae bacterium]
FEPSAGETVITQAQKLRAEDVISVVGCVKLRPLGQENKNLVTGEIEIHSTDLTLLNRSEVPPFTPGQQDLPNEDLRLKYRYLDLRREEMQQTLALRSQITNIMRDYFQSNGFLDIETPILGRSTPEGARDYLVPSRVHEGLMYALPQSPQLYKQILMVAGYDRYMQIARCFRDEDLRADRQPEFTQLDLEMSFVEQEDVLTIVDGLVARLVKDLLGQELSLPLPRMTWDEAMERFGHDAPDLRFGMEIVDCTDLAAKAEFRVFSATATSEGGAVRGLNVKGGAANYTRRKIDALTEFVQKDLGAKGLAWFRVEEEGTLFSPIAKNFSTELLGEIKERLDAEPGDLLLFSADQWLTTCKVLHGLRKKIGAEMKLYDSNDFHFSWVTDFPMFEFNEDENRWDSMHHPFTAPRTQDLPLLDSEIAKCRAQAYDLVINGYEAGGGTIRIHDNKIQQKVFNLLGIDEKMAAERFGYLLDALQYGAPPHGGIALGLDRIVMLFARTQNIRDCIAFPKTQRATDLMTNAPNTVDTRQLDELALKIIPQSQR